MRFRYPKKPKRLENRGEVIKKKKKNSKKRSLYIKDVPPTWDRQVDQGSGQALRMRSRSWPIGGASGYDFADRKIALRKKEKKKENVGIFSSNFIFFAIEKFINTS